MVRILQPLNRTSDDMHTTYFTRGYLVAIVLFGLPLAALGYQAASWWGVVAGAVVGAVVADRMIRRGSVEAAASQAHAVIPSAPVASIATVQAAVNTPGSRAR